MQAVTYRPADTLDKDAILALLKVNTPFIPSELAGPLFDWQFLGTNPCASDRQFFLVAVCNGSIAGVNGIMPVRVQYQGDEVEAVWSCDTLVADDFRGKGIGKGLLARVSLEAPVVLGYGISDMSDPIVRKLGWNDYDGVDTFFYFHAEKGLRGVLKNGRSKFKAVVGALRRESSRIEVGKLVDRFSTEHDQLWRDVAGGYPFAVIRDAAYLNWRYRDHPVLKYDVLEARRDGRLVASLILRHDAYESVIADFVGPTDDVATMHALIHAGLSGLTARGTDRIRCETSLNTLKKSLNIAGFNHYKVPSRFKFYHADVSLKVDQPSWFVMTGDSDNECSQVAKIFKRAQG